MGGIYAIRHASSGRIYIGSAVDIRTRWRIHRKELRKGSHHSCRLQRAWDKYGADAFVFEVLEVVGRREDLVPVEQAYLDHFQTWRPASGYNIAAKAGSRLGLRCSAETRAKMSEVARSRPPEHWARLAEEARSPEGRARRAELARSPEQRARLLVATTTPEFRAKIAETNRGRKHSDETRAKMSAAQKGKVVSAETRDKLSAAHEGRKLSAETRARMSAAVRPARSPEVIARIAATRRANMAARKAATRDARHAILKERCLIPLRMPTEPRPGRGLQGLLFDPWGEEVEHAGD
jgi:group I intron endonuclease